MNGQTVSNLIRSKTDIVDIIGERIPLVKKEITFLEFVRFMMILILQCLFLEKNKYILVLLVTLREMFLSF